MSQVATKNQPIPVDPFPPIERFQQKAKLIIRAIRHMARPCRNMPSPRCPLRWPRGFTASGIMTPFSATYSLQSKEELNGLLLVSFHSSKTLQVSHKNSVL